MNTRTPVPPPFRYPDQSILIHKDDLDREDRSRIEYGNLQELWESISEGLIHPPTVSRNPQTGKYKLIAGGRRTGAMLWGGLEWFPVVSFDDLSDEQIIRMEGEENFKRLGMNWKEKVLLIARRHDICLALAVENHENWGMRETGALLGCSHASVSHATQIRPYILEGDPDICGADTLRKAYDILLDRREKQAAALAGGLLGMSSEKMSSATIGVIGDINIDDMLGLGDPLVGNMNLDGAPKDKRPIHVADYVGPEIGSELTQPTVIAPLEVKDFPLSKLLFCGDFRDLMPKFAAESVHHVITDIPYGIEMENLDTIKGLEDMVATHDVEQNVEMMRPFLEQSYRVIKDGGFCIFWYDLDHHEKLHKWAEEVGFQKQNWPLVWHKLHPCKNAAATKNWTKNVEFAMVLRKGNAVLSKPQSSCIIAADASSERKLYSNPFAKPRLAWNFLLEPVAFKGQTILDPFAGEMSSVRPMIDLGLNFVAIELDKDRFFKGVQVVKNKLLEVTGGAATFS